MRLGVPHVHCSVAQRLPQPSHRGVCVSDIGDILRNAREKKNLSVLDVATATRIKASYLEALEQGEYGLLPGPAYVTGFLKNYASFVGLHPDDVVQEYHTLRPSPQPAVRPATRVLASGHERQMRGRVLLVLSAVVLLFAGGFAIKEYNDTYMHPYTPQVNLTPANLGAASLPLAVSHATLSKRQVYLHLRSRSPVWVRVTVDGRRAYQGILRPTQRRMHWVARKSIYVATLDGAQLQVTYDGRPRGRMAARPGLVVDVATATGWRVAS
jgi:hypothetical protein